MEPMVIMMLAHFQYFSRKEDRNTFCPKILRLKTFKYVAKEMEDRFLALRSLWSSYEDLESLYSFGAKRIKATRQH